MLLSDAFGVDGTDILGPEWLRHWNLMTTSDKYDIQAVLPPQTTKEQLQAMLKSLLEERFALQTHRQTKTVPAYALTVAKGGPKIQSDTGSPPAVQGDDGFPVASPDHNGPLVRIMAGYIRFKFIHYSMKEFATWTRTQTMRPGIDHSRLSGRYSFYLDVNNELTRTKVEGEPISAVEGRGEGFSAAIERQLGLKLVPDNTEIELLIIDHINRTPKGN